MGSGRGRRVRADEEGRLGVSGYGTLLSLSLKAQVDGWSLNLELSALNSGLCTWLGCETLGTRRRDTAGRGFSTWKRLS
jgi:hypothetical protein